MTAAAWRVDATSDTSGWLLIPDAADAAVRDAWIDAQVEAIRENLDAGWNDAIAAYFRALIETGCEHRRPEDAMTFLVWPAAAPACIVVHVAIAAYAEGDPRPGPGDGNLCDSGGLGPGIQVPLADTLDGRDLAGLRFVFSSPTHAVVVEAEPTAPALLVGALGSLHAFVDRLVVHEPSGERFRAEAPDLLEARSDGRWADSVA